MELRNGVRATVGPTEGGAPQKAEPTHGHRLGRHCPYLPTWASESLASV